MIVTSSVVAKPVLVTNAVDSEVIVSVPELTVSISVLYTRIVEVTSGAVLVYPK